MSRISSWFRSSDPVPRTSPAELLHTEMADITAAFAATELIMDDDMDGAEAILRRSGDSCYHAMALAVISFMRAVLGFEKEVMATAAAELAACETRAAADARRAQRDFPPEICGPVYPAGTEYQLVVAEAQLMGAVVGVLHESLTEALRSVYKLRKAYFALESMTAIKEKAMAATAAATLAGSVSEKLAGDVLEDAAECQADEQTPRDMFIHSGIGTCFGALLFLFSMIPPAFSRLLSLIGLRGDRYRGIQLLWQSTAFANVHGAVAALILLSYYHGLLGFSDILPTRAHWDERADAVGYPRERCKALLSEMKTRYPSSALWRLEEARLCSAARDLPGALAVLQRNDAAPKMKQVQALLGFELALNALFAQRWSLMKTAFVAAMDLNDWSHSMYLFLAAAAEIEMYRDAVVAGAPADQAAAHKKEATELLGRVAGAAGRKKFLAKQLPFEQYVTRKLVKWEARAAQLGVDLVDAVGVSPATEMTVLWNGLARMDAELATAGLKLVEWERVTGARAEIEAAADERASWAVCRAGLLRTLGRVDEAQGVLRAEVLGLDRAEFRGTGEDWILPVGHYEMAVCCWRLAMDAEGETVGANVSQCQEYLDKVAGWESFTLDARIGIRVQTGLETLAWFKSKP
ncbi:hypothetical protein TD95_000175 [Thielaviopsis punctulata]|uniref:Inclusion body clearance protein IML2 n=1 Tax=Thielaviopsis punctulata TaxID=72032 RepID=A0A0F4ZE10_9PEZI|nr:hypothetical protein TD95_000175 [Thielaviopsis punctulata]